MVVLSYTQFILAILCHQLNMKGVNSIAYISGFIKSGFTHNLHNQQKFKIRIS